jgi:RHS repeat-associated protein
MSEGGRKRCEPIVRFRIAEETSHLTSRSRQQSHCVTGQQNGRVPGYTYTMEVRAAPSFTSSPDAISATCQLVVTYDWSSTRYFLPDHLNSTNVLTDASGTLIQALDYYPYGSTRISQTTGSFNEQKQYIGQYSDPETNLSYLQARYYDGSKGEFLSEDPVFLGDPKQQTLTDPQSLNSYSYANDNPVIKSDPTGRAYLELSAAGTFEGWSGSFGVRADLYGINVFAAGGFGVGTAGYPISASLSSGDLPRKTETTMTVGGDAAYLVGLGASGSGTYQPNTYSVTNKSGNVSLLAGYGADAYLRKEVSTPVFGGLSPDGLVLGKASSFSTPNYVAAPRPSTYMGSNMPSLTMYRGQSSNSFSIPGVSLQPSRQSTSGGGNAVSSWLGAFNPFSPH